MGRHNQQIDWKYRIAAGMTYGAEPLFKFGVNPAVSAGTPETVWFAGGDKVLQTTAQTISTVSDNANDTSAGTGARTATIYGLDANYDKVNETITLNGATPVLTTQTFLRVFRVIINTSGSSDYNEGTISCTYSSTGDAAGEVPPTEGQTLQAIYTVPRKHLLIMDQLYCSVQKKASSLASFHFELKPQGGSWNLKQVIGAYASGSSGFERRYTIPFPITEKTDIRVRVHDITGTDVQVSAAFDGVLLDLEKFTGF